MSAGKVSLGAFRTYPKVSALITFCSARPVCACVPIIILLCAYVLHCACIQGYKPAADGSSQYQTIPLDKIEDFGVHCKQYYSLTVSYFKSSLDSYLLDLLWNKYWVNTLSSCSLLTVSNLWPLSFVRLGVPIPIKMFRWQTFGFWTFCLSMKLVFFVCTIIFI